MSVIGCLLNYAERRRTSVERNPTKQDRQGDHTFNAQSLPKHNLFQHRERHKELCSVENTPSNTTYVSQ